MKKIGFTLLLLMFSLSVPGGSANGGKLYKWIDEKGVIHFSDRRPEGSEKVMGVLEERDLHKPGPSLQAPFPAKANTAGNPIEHAANCTFTIKSSAKIGTGFLLHSNGFAATCKHVVDGIQAPKAVLHDQSEYPLNVVAISPKYDLALVQVLGAPNLPFLSLRDAETVALGERLFAIGSSAGLQSTITDGVFTGFRKVGLTEERLIQFSAPVNQGNSGGPLLDVAGKVIGVVSMKVLLLDGTPITGIGFAVPSSSFLEEFYYMIQ
jgi:S1-C subfamily serine protease